MCTCHIPPFYFDNKIMLMEALCAMLTQIYASVSGMLTTKSANSLQLGHP
jgi:hypothetical protein